MAFIHQQNYHHTLLTFRHLVYGDGSDVFRVRQRDNVEPGRPVLATFLV